MVSFEVIAIAPKVQNGEFHFVEFSKITFETVHILMHQSLLKNDTRQNYSFQMTTSLKLCKGI